jgi:exopolysaccharide biosynthesis polyprenyl glycosylphosphotransferase
MLSSASDNRIEGGIVVDMKADLSPEWERFIADRALDGTPVYDSKQVFESLSGRVQVEHLSENTFAALTPNSIYASGKRHIDFLLAVAATALVGPLLVLVGIAIRLESRGPALFRQKRIGYRGREFTVYKLRTMRVSESGLETLDSQITKDRDPRITSLGRFLRKTRMDELPQIINILRGEMSWIGPRPEAVKLSAWYESKIPFYRYRHMVRPGITGWAQVSQGHVTTLDDADLKLQYDFFYVKNFSLWLDILVLLRTIRVVFTGSGAR